MFELAIDLYYFGGYKLSSNLSSMKKSLLALFLVVFTFSANSQTGIPKAKIYDEIFIGPGSAWGMAQDKRGILYLATDEGIYEYDGERFNRIKLPLAIGLCIDSDGEVYAAGSGAFGKLESNDQGIVEFKSLLSLAKDSIKLGTARTVVASKTKIYCFSKEVILEYDKQKNTLVPYFAQDGFYSFDGFVRDEKLYFSHSSKGLMCLADGKISPVSNNSLLNQLPIKVWGMRSSGGAYDPQSDERFFSFSGNFFKYKGNVISRLPIDNQSGPLAGAEIYKILPIGKAYQLITTLNKGAMLVDTLGNVLHVYRDSTSLQGNVIVSAFKDNLENIWLGFMGAKNRLAKTEHGQDISVWDQWMGINETITAFVGTDKDFIYASSSENFYAINRTTKAILKTPLHVKGMTMFSNKGKNLLMVVTATDVHEFENGKFKTIYSNKLETLRGASQSTRYPDRLYVQSEENLGYLLYKNGQWKYHLIAKGIYAETIEEDDQSALWIRNGRDRKLVRIEPSNDTTNFTVKLITEFNSKYGLPDTVYSSFPLNNQVAFTTSRGVYIFNREKNVFSKWNEFSKRHLASIHQANFIVQSPKDKSLYLLNFEPQVTLSRVYQTAQGDTAIDYNSFKRVSLAGIRSLNATEDGKFWVVGSMGIIEFDWSKLTKNYDLSFHSLIRRVTVGKDSILFNGGLANSKAPSDIKLDYKFGNLVIQFAAPFFDSEDQTLYSYQLEGNDDDWSAWSRQSYKEYTGLLEGNYTFKVKAKNVYGNESSVALFAFQVMPPWYRTWWAYLFYALLTGLFMLGIVRWRTHELNRKKQELEELVQSKTKELVNTNHELEASQEELRQSNDELIATNEYLQKTQRQLVESEKMASLGQLTAGLAHEINNPINFISGGVQALESLSDSLVESKNLSEEQIASIKADMKDLINSINNGVSRTAAIVNGLKVFSNAGEDTNALLDVTEPIENALLLVSNRLKQNQISVIKEFHHQSYVKASGSHISQVLINMLDNSIRALASVEGEKIIRISTEETKDHILIKLRDNGEGIPSELHDHIFEPFFTTREVGSGAGLGLYICYSLVAKNNGKITFVSQQGAGTEFSILLHKGV